ncbi:MAG: hypothetical protein LBT24_05615 [Tannerella sp.]|nr:hypothetical protein [Tannerella sp.]
MITTTDKIDKKKTNWLFPDDNEVITVIDFCEMVKEAENTPTYTYEEHRRIVKEWQRNHQ